MRETEVILSDYFVEDLNPDGDFTGNFRLIVGTSASTDGRIRIKPSEELYSPTQALQVATVMRDAGVKSPIEKTQEEAR